MNKEERVLIRLAREKAKMVRDQETMLTVRQVIASPVFQIVGSVVIAELAEKAGILSGRWAGALEGSVIAMVGFQALKEFGVLGAGALGVGLGGGAIVSDIISNPWEFSKDWASAGLKAGGNPLAGLLNYFTNK